MRISSSGGRLALLSAILTAPAAAGAILQGTIVDPSGAGIPGAQVSAVNRLGIVARTATRGSGDFILTLPETGAARLVITAPGFATRTLPLDTAEQPLRIRLELAPQVDAIRVVGSTLDVPVSEQGGSVSVVPRQEIAERNEPLAVDLLRYLPGVAVAQNAAPGGAAGLFLRGGNYNFNLVQIDGVTVNSFGGAFDFAHVPASWLEQVEVIRGPQSAVYGAYANSGVVNFVTRAPEDSPPLDLLAEGGTYHERRFSVGSAGTFHGLGLAAFAARMDTDGPVVNSDYRNESVLLHATRAFGHHFLAFSGNFLSSANGVPGPYGSDPAGLFTGLDRISRNNNNQSGYILRYHGDLTPRLRQEAFASFFLENNYYVSPYGDSYNKDIRGSAETRSVISVNSSYFMSVGASFTREEVKNTYLSDNSFRSFPLHRDQEGIYWENRIQLGSRLFWNAGVRADVIRTPLIPANAALARPEFAARTIVRANPKIAAAYIARKDRDAFFGSSRLHGSFGTGIRPPAGLELAFTDNPALKPERTVSYDFGLEQRFSRNRLSVDATWFYNRFSDLIVSLGGTLARLSSYQSDNLSNSRAQGLELSAHLRPARWVSVAGSYTYLNSEILSLDGSAGLAPAYFRVGQPLIRRPTHSGAVVSTFRYGRITANATGYFRGSVLDVEPNLGASAGLYRNRGFADLGINLNYHVAGGLTIYGSLRNALNQRYEETFGYPSPLLNFVTGMKWTLARSR